MEQNDASIGERVRTAIIERGVDLGREIDRSVKEEIAAEVGSTPGSVAKFISGLRHENGLSLPQVPGRFKATNGHAPSAESAGLRRLTAVLLEIGLSQVEPESLRPVLRDLALSAIGCEEAGDGT